MLDNKLKAKKKTETEKSNTISKQKHIKHKYKDTT